MDDTGQQRELYVGMVEACFGPDGGLVRRPEGQASEKVMLEGYLEAAKAEGLDAEAIYKEAVKNLRKPELAPEYASVAPREKAA